MNRILNTLTVMLVFLLVFIPPGDAFEYEVGLAFDLAKIHIFDNGEKVMENNETALTHWLFYRPFFSLILNDKVAVNGSFLSAKAELFLDTHQPPRATWQWDIHADLKELTTEIEYRLREDDVGIAVKIPFYYQVFDYNRLHLFRFTESGIHEYYLDLETISLGAGLGLGGYFRKNFEFWQCRFSADVGLTYTYSWNSFRERRYWQDYWDPTQETSITKPEKNVSTQDPATRYRFGIDLTRLNSPLVIGVYWVGEHAVSYDTCTSEINPDMAFALPIKRGLRGFEFSLSTRF